MIQAKIQVYLWLGSIKHKKNYPSGLPPGFQPTNELQNAERPAVPPPPIIHYSEKHVSSHLLKEMFCLFVSFEWTPSRRKEVGISLGILPHVRDSNTYRVAHKD